MKARDAIAGLQRDEAALAAQEEGVRRRRLAIQATINEWERAAALYTEAMDLNGSAPPGQISASLDAPTGSVGELSEQYMAEHGGSAKISDIVNWLVAIGKLSIEKRPEQNYGAVYTAMLRHPERFEKVGRGEFRLLPQG